MNNEKTAIQKLIERLEKTLDHRSRDPLGNHIEIEQDDFTRGVESGLFQALLVAKDLSKE